MSEILVDFIRSVYKSEDFIPLHEPRFDSKDKDLLIKTLDSTYVSSAGPLVEEFEKKCGLYTGSNFCVSTFNGTSALHAGLKVLDIRPEDEVITQSLTFVATVNAIHLCGASPVFIDVDRNTLGMSPKYLQDFLNNNCEIREDGCWNKATSKLIKACMPMHTFGFPCEIDKIAEICKNYKIEVIEDAAESLGSFYKNKHTVFDFAFNEYTLLVIAVILGGQIGNYFGVRVFSDAIVRRLTSVLVIYVGIRLIINI